TMPAEQVDAMLASPPATAAAPRRRSMAAERLPAHEARTGASPVATLLSEIADRPEIVHLRVEKGDEVVEWRRATVRRSRLRLRRRRDARASRGRRDPRPAWRRRGACQDPRLRPSARDLHEREPRGARGVRRRAPRRRARRRRRRAPDASSERAFLPTHAAAG